MTTRTLRCTAPFAGELVMARTMAEVPRDIARVGARIAVVGDAADTLALVTELVTSKAVVKVFQLAPAWVLPQQCRSARRTRLPRILVPRLPVERTALAHLHRQVPDPWLRRQLTPDAPAARARVATSDAFYPALQRPNCKLITWPIASITPVGIRTSDGIEHHVDVIVLVGVGIEAGAQPVGC